MDRSAIHMAQNKNDKAILKLKLEKEQFRKPVETQIETLKAELEKATAEKFAARENRLKKKREELLAMEKHVIEQGVKDKWRHMIPTDSKQLVEWLPLYENKLVGGYVTKNALEHLGYDNDSITPRHLTNGVHIIAVKAWHWKIYVAFKGDKVVGNLTVQVPRHPGDYIEAEGCVNKETIELKDPSKWYGVTKPFGKWKAALLKIK